MSTAYPDRIAALREWAEMSPDQWARDYAAAFIEKYERNLDMDWSPDEAWRRAEAQVEHYGRGA